MNPTPGSAGRRRDAERIGAPLATVGVCAVALGAIGLITRHYQLLRG